jgi:hypothetical protein
MADGPEIRLRDMITMIIGVVIAVAPWFNGDDAYSHGAIRLRFVAACICGLSLWIIAHQRDVKAEFANALLGIALITAPLWRGGIDPYRVDMAVAGAIVAVFSASCAIRIIRERHAEQHYVHSNSIEHRFSLN